MLLKNKMEKLSHFDEQGKIKMVDVSEKAETARRAVASGKVLLNAETLKILKSNENPKGNPLEIARIAGIMAAKQTSNLIPLCHQINLVESQCQSRIERLRHLFRSRSENEFADRR